MKLNQLIKENKFDWVNPDITEKNFPPQKISKGKYKLFHFGGFINSEDAKKEMEAQGYQPANIYELLSWNEWDGKDYIVALGSVCVLPSGRRDVAVLSEGSDGRSLNLGWVGLDWGGYCRFLAVSKSLGHSDTLENRVKELENKMDKISKGSV